MPDRSTISRIAKILARAGSDNPNEAAAALDGAYKRMVRDGVTLHDLLSLSTDELYQDTLVKLVDLILSDQPNLSPSNKREAYSQYLLLIAARFSGSWDGQSDRSSGSSAGQGSRAEEAREYEERRAREEATKRRANPEPPRNENPFKPETATTPKVNRSFTFNLGTVDFSFSPANFFAALQTIFGRGSIFWYALRDPSRALRLFAVCLLFGAGFASIVLTVAAIGHSLTHTGPLWDIKLKNAFSFLVAIGCIWKAIALHHAGWFR